MKSLQFLVILVLLGTLLLSGQVDVRQPIVAPASCVWPTGVTTGMAACATNDPTSPIYVALNGGPFQKATAAVASGVSSWNGRTGAVLPAANDYSYSQLSGKPTTVSCTTYTISNTGGISFSGCTIQ